MPIRNITPSSYVGPQTRKFRTARGWSLAIISAAVTMHFLAGALVVANLHDYLATTHGQRIQPAGVSTAV